MTKPSKLPPSTFIPYSDGDLYPPALHEVDADTVQIDGTTVFEQPITDHWIHAELNLPQGEEMKKVKVVGWSKDGDGNIIGKYEINPMLNTMVYDVDFPDGSISKYRANLRENNMYPQVDSRGFLHSILFGILDFAKYTTIVQKGNQYIITKSGQRRMRISTVGWKLLIAWKDGIKQWIPLSVMKYSYPIEFDKFSTAHGISDEHAFAWWVPYTLQKGIRLFLLSMTGWNKQHTSIVWPFLDQLKKPTPLIQKMATSSGEMHWIKKCPTYKWRLIF